MYKENFNLSFIIRKLIIIFLCFIFIYNNFKFFYSSILFIIFFTSYLLILYKKELEYNKIEDFNEDELIIKLTNLKASYIYKEYEELVIISSKTYEYAQSIINNDDLKQTELEKFKNLEILKKEKLELYNNTILKDINYDFYLSDTLIIYESIFRDFSMAFLLISFIVFFLN